MKGPAWLMAGIGLWAVLDANSKLLSGSYPAWQVIGVRYVVLLALLLLARGLFPGAGGTLRSAVPGLQALRAVSQLGAALGFFMALRHLPMAEGYLIYFTAPFMTLGLAAILLRERMPAAAWGWTAVGFGGVLFALMPGLRAGGSWDGYLWAPFAAFCYAAVLTLNRRLREEASFALLVFWPAMVGLLACLPGMALGWRWPSALDLLLLSANGIIAGAATVSLALAFRHDTAARLAPYEFTALLWALGFDLLLWGKAPAWTTLGGAVVVIVACLMGERVARRSSGLARLAPGGGPTVQEMPSGKM